MASAIASARRHLRDPFVVARLRLAALYSVVTMFVIVHFSLALFYSLERSTWSAIDSEVSAPYAQRLDLFTSTIDAIEDGIVATDVVLVFLVAFAGYFIAGKVLAPIDANMRAQRRFIADVSHDLRTPLAIMKSEGQIYLNDKNPDPSESRAVVESSLEEVAKMSALVDDLLIVARTEGELDSSRIEPIELQALLRKIVTKNAKRAEQKGVALALASADAGMMNADVLNLERALQNIVSNAINYTERGTVAVSGIAESKRYIVRVEDTGVGIAPADLAHVFERFYKAEHSRKSGAGSGLGLSIAKQIIEQHGGEIRLTSEIGKGTTANIVLPRLVA